MRTTTRQRLPEQLLSATFEPPGKQGNYIRTQRPGNNCSTKMKMTNVNTMMKKDEPSNRQGQPRAFNASQHALTTHAGDTLRSACADIPCGTSLQSACADNPCGPTITQHARSVPMQVEKPSNDRNQKPQRHFIKSTTNLKKQRVQIQRMVNTIGDLAPSDVYKTICLRLRDSHDSGCQKTSSKHGSIQVAPMLASTV